MDLDQRDTERSTVALAMIVKDEEEIILRAINSVKRVVDYYCICDTGSSDNTVQIVKDYLEENGLDGEVHECDWVNFAHNRNEAFRLAAGKCEYIMTLDADEVLAAYIDGEPDNTKMIAAFPPLTADMYLVKTHNYDMRYDRTQLFKDGLDWRWESPVHEFCTADNLETVETLTDCCIIPLIDGSRARDDNRFLWDAFEFEKAIAQEPTNSRYWFYLGQSYQDSMRASQAIDAYKTCIVHSDWPEEIAVACLRIGRLIQKTKGFDEAAVWYWRSYDAQPSRAEALYEMVMFYNETGMQNAAKVVRELLLKCKPEDSLLFVENHVYEWIKNEEQN